MKPPRCESCDQPIWNPLWWEETGMCGPCSTGEAAELFPEIWIPPLITAVSTDEDFLSYWQQWYEQVWLKEPGNK